MHTYIAALEPDGRGGFGVFFPDIPGLASAGDNREDAIRQAMQGLSGHVAAMRDDGDDVPAARSLEQLLRDDAVAETLQGCVLFAVPLLEAGGAQMRINVSATRREIEAIDEAAQRRGLTRSAFLIAAAQEKIASEAG